jgi:hypothetical protein
MKKRLATTGAAALFAMRLTHYEDSIMAFGSFPPCSSVGGHLGMAPLPLNPGTPDRTNRGGKWLPGSWQTSLPL